MPSSSNVCEEIYPSIDVETRSEESKTEGKPKERKKKESKNESRGRLPVPPKIPNPSMKIESSTGTGKFGQTM